MNKVNCFTVVNTGLEYLVMNHGVVLCSFITKREANARAFELAQEFGGSICRCR